MEVILNRKRSICTNSFFVRRADHPTEQWFVVVFLLGAAHEAHNLLFSFPAGSRRPSYLGTGTTAPNTTTTHAREREIVSMMMMTPSFTSSYIDVSTVIDFPSIHNESSSFGFGTTTTTTTEIGEFTDAATGQSGSGYYWYRTGSHGHCRHGHTCGPVRISYDHHYRQHYDSSSSSIVGMDEMSSRRILIFSTGSP